MAFDEANVRGRVNRRRDGNSDRPDTIQEREECNASQGFSGTQYNWTTENKKTTVKTRSLFEPEDTSTTFNEFSKFRTRRDTRRTSENFQGKSAPESLFSRGNYSSVSSNAFSETSSDKYVDTGACQHRSLFGTDFGGNRNYQFERHFADNKHLFHGSVSSYQSKTLHGSTGTQTYAGYKHTPSGSRIDVQANFTDSDMNVHGQGKYNVDKNNSLFGSVMVNRRGDTYDSHGELGYHHQPSRSKVAVGVCNNAGGTDLTLRSQTKVFGERNKHALDGNIFLKQTVGGPFGVDANLDYKHKPTNTNFNLGVGHQNGTTMVNTGVNTRIKNTATLGASGHYTESPESRSFGFQLSGGI